MLVSHSDDDARSSLTLQNPRLTKLGSYVASMCRSKIMCTGLVHKKAWCVKPSDPRVHPHRTGDFGGRVLYASSLAASSVLGHPGACGSSSGAVEQRYVFDTCYVVDLCQWKDDMTVCVKSRFPEADVKIVHSTTSLTGFCVVIKIPPPEKGGASCAAGGLLPGLDALLGDYEFVDSCIDSNPGPPAGKRVQGASAGGGQSEEERVPASLHGTIRACMGILARLAMPACTRRFLARCARLALYVPLRLYLRMERQQAHLSGMLTAAGILYGTYFLVRYIRSGGGGGVEGMMQPPVQGSG